MSFYKSVQLAKKERTNELNSKFDKTYKIFSKSYHNLISKENYCLFLMTYNLSNKSFH
jgi:hypothetical protein